MMEKMGASTSWASSAKRREVGQRLGSYSSLLELLHEDPQPKILPLTMLR